MKLREVIINNRKRQLELTTRAGAVYPIPFRKLDPKPTPADRIRTAYIDKELGNEAVTYVLESGAEGAVHIDHALEYNQDPSYMTGLLVHKLTVEAQRRLKALGMSRRELARRLNTSVPQVYRLLDPQNSHKSLTQVVSLLHVLDCDVDLIVKPRSAA